MRFTGAVETQACMFLIFLIILIPLINRQIYFSYYWAAYVSITLSKERHINMNTYAVLQNEIN